MEFVELSCQKELCTVIWCNIL